MYNLNNKVQIYEVGPRDGFQNIKEFIPTDVKLKIIDDLVDSGIKHLQVTSFVNPKAIAQMIDAPIIAKECLAKYPNLDIFALSPNIRGVETAAEVGIKKISFVISLSESHNKANVNKTVDHSFAELELAIKNHPEMEFCVDMATAFGCPFEGFFTYDKIKERVERIISYGIKTVQISDTIGTANPQLTYDYFSALIKDFPNIQFRTHFHDTRGMGLANALASINAGVTMMETAIAGFGGCPFAPGASGNLSTEDLVYTLQAMKMDTGDISFSKLKKVAVYAKDNIKGNPSGHHIYIKDSVQNIC